MDHEVPNERERGTGPRHLEFDRLLGLNSVQDLYIRITSLMGARHRGQ